MRRTLLIVVAAVPASGCGDDPRPPGAGGTGGSAPIECVAAEVEVDGLCVPAGTQPGGCLAGEIEPLEGGCAPAGVPDLPCPPGELLVEGACIAAGVPAEVCRASGFQPTGDGSCNALLPATPCAAGTMAIPGEISCREIMACGNGAWGDEPLPVDTVYVDASFAGAGDGSAAAPYSSLTTAIAAAAPGATIAVAAGSYASDLVIEGKPVRVRGRCPTMVEIVGSATAAAALEIRAGADGTELSGVALRGGSRGLSLSGAAVIAERLWIHDTAGDGLEAIAGSSPTQVTLRDSLVERAHGRGIASLGSEVTVERCAIRDGQPATAGTHGRGLDLAPDAAGTPSTAELRASVVERNLEIGVRVSGSTAVIEGCVVRETAPSLASQTGGWGMAVQQDPDAGLVADVAVERSIIEANHVTGIGVYASSVQVDATVVRGTLAQPSDLKFGRGLALDGGDVGASVSITRSVSEDNQQAGLIVYSAQADVTSSIVRRSRSGWPPELTGVGVIIVSDEAQPRASLHVAGSRIEDNLVGGLVATSADVTLEQTAVLRTAPAEVTNEYGAGIEIASDIDSWPPGHLEMRGCLVADNTDVGVNVNGAEAIIDATVVRGTQLNAATGEGGIGVHAQFGGIVDVRSKLLLTRSLVEDNHSHAVGVHGSDGSIVGTLIRGTKPESNGSYGRGLNVQDYEGQPGAVEVRGVVIEDNVEVGVFADHATTTFEGVVVRNTAARPDGTAGRGMALQLGEAPAAIRWSVIEGNHDLGVLAHEVQLELLGVVVRHTAARPSDGGFGDGVFFQLVEGSTVQGCRIEDSARAGIANFGGSVAMADTVLECNAFHLDGELLGQPFSFEDRQGNVCGCEGDEITCKVLSAQLEPPAPAPVAPDFGPGQGR